MLVPGIRLVERPGVLHFVDGRRVVSVHGEDAVRAAVRDVSLGTATVTALGADERAEIEQLLERMQLTVGGDAIPENEGGAEPGDAAAHRDRGAAYVSASVAGWIAPHEVNRRLREVTVHVWGDDAWSLRSLLVDSGLQCRTLECLDDIGRLEPGRVVVAAVAPAAGAATVLGDVNRRCLAAGIPWLPVGAYDGACAHVGPLIVPGQTACFECLLVRLAANVEYADIYRDVVADAPAAPTPPGLHDWSCSVAALVLLRWIGGRDPRLPGTLFTLVADELRVDRSTVYRVPRCGTCAAPDYVAAAAPWELR